MRRFSLAVLLLLLGCTASSVKPPASVQAAPMLSLNEVYTDESHCLVSPEIRTKRDNPRSCYCRDAIVDARYVYHNYFTNGKDSNFAGIVLSLEAHARDVCNQAADVSTAIEQNDWQWNGPEVTRIYPSDSEIEQIKPDARGFRMVPYEVRLVFRDGQGHVVTSERFWTVEKFFPNWKPKKS